MATSIRGINAVIGAETTGLQKALSDVNKKSKDIQSELRRVERALKFNPNDTILLAQKQKLLGDQVATTREKLDRLRVAQAQVNEQFRKGEISEGQYRAFQREIVETESKLKHFERQLASTKKGLDDYGKSMQDAGRKMTDAGKNLSMKVTAPIVGLGAMAIKTGIDFEQSMSQVKSVSGATASEMATMEKAARDAGKATSKSASDAANALYYMSLAGWDVNKSTTALMPVLRLAEAGSLDLGRASDLVTDSMAAMQLEVEELPWYLDMVAQASRESNTDIDALMEAFLIAGGTLASFNVPVEESTALLGILANRGYKGAQAGTAMNAIFTNLTSGMGASGKALKELGISAFDSQGNFKGLEVTLLELKAKLADMTEEQQAQYISMIAGKEHLKTFQALLTGLGAEYGDFKDKVIDSTGALDEMAITAQDNLKGRLTALSSAISEVALQLYDAMKPALEFIVALMQKVVNWIDKLSPEMKMVVVVIAGLAAAIGPLLIVLGLVASGLGSILTILPALGAAFAVVTGPIGIAVAAIAALVAGLVYLYKTNEDVRANMQVVWKAIKTVIDATMKVILFIIKSVWDNIKGVISGALNVIQGVINVFAGILTGDFKTMWEGIKQIFSGAVEFIFNFVQLMFIGKIVAIFKNFAKAGFELLKGNWTNILNGVKQFGTSILNFFKGLWDNTISTFKNFSSTGTNIFNTLKNTLTSIVQGLINAIKNLFTSMSSSVTSTMSSLRTSIQNIWNSIVSFFRGINLRDIGRNIIQGLINGITSMASEAMRAARNLADNVSSTIKNALKISSPSKVMEGYGKFISEGLAQGIDATRYKVSDSAAALVGGVTAPAARVVTAAADGSAVGTGGGGVTITGNTFYVRNDNDIRLIARELYNLQQQGARGRGIG